MGALTADPIAFLLAAYPRLLTSILQVIHRAISTFLIKQAGLKRSEAQTGAISLNQLFGSAAKLNTTRGTGPELRIFAATNYNPHCTRMQLKMLTNFSLAVCTRCVSSNDRSISAIGLSRNLSQRFRYRSFLLPWYI